MVNIVLAFLQSLFQIVGIHKSLFLSEMTLKAIVRELVDFF